MGEWIFRGLLAVGLIFFVLEGRKYSPHAALLPQLVAGATLLFLILDAVVALRAKGFAREGVLEEETDERLSGGHVFWETPRFYATAVCLVAFWLLFPYLGDIITSMLFILVLTWALGERRWYVITSCTILVPPLFHYLAEHYLKVVMPVGELWEMLFPAWFE